MPRPTKDQIDAEIVDRASALFARQGYRQTSLQQVADEVGYSKAGLLHRFPSKDAIYRAAVRTAQDRTLALVEATASLGAGAQRDRALIESLLDTAWELPGTADFLSSVVANDPTAVPELVESGVALATAFGIDPGKPDDERMTRILVATAGLQSAAAAAARADRRRDWRAHIIAAAMDALGHPGRPV